MKTTIRQNRLKFSVKLAISAVVFLSSLCDLHAQEARQHGLIKNTISTDIALGIVSQATINYERLVFSREKVNLYTKVGLGVGQVYLDTSELGGLGGITMLTGKKNNHFELNGGLSVSKILDNNSFIDDSPERMTTVFPFLNIGYRYQKPEGGFIFKSYVGAILNVGIGLGYAF